MLILLLLLYTLSSLGITTVTGAGSTLCEDRNVRLVDGRANCGGRVEVCWNEQWHTVCDNNNRNMNTATAVCSQLGFVSDGAQTVSGSYFGQQTAPISYVDVDCKPNQEVRDCSITESDCTPSLSVGVICQLAMDSPCIPDTPSQRSTCPMNNITITQTQTNTCHEKTLLPAQILTTTVQVTNYTCTATPSPTTELMLKYTTEYVTKYTCTVTPTLMSELIRTKYVTNNCTPPTIENIASSTSEMSQYLQSSQDSNCNKTADNNNIASTGGLGAFTGILIVALIGVSMGWVCTCVIMRRMKTGKYNLHRSGSPENQLHNPVYFESLASNTQPTDASTSAQYSALGPAYELLNTESTISTTTQDDDHTYAVIPHQRSKRTNKPLATNTQSQPGRSENIESKSLPFHNREAPPIPPRVNNNNGGNNDQGITESLNRSPIDSPRSDHMEGGCHVLEQRERSNDEYHMLEGRSSWLLDGASSKPEGFYHVLEQREPASSQVQGERRSRLDGDTNGGEKGKERPQDDSAQISPTDNVEWESRSPATYEVPMPKRIYSCEQATIDVTST